MDQNPSGESEHGLRADSVLYLCLLLQWNVLRALFTAEALLHTSYSFFGSCGGCRNNEIIIPIIPSNGGNETAFVPCSRLHQLRRFCSTSRATFAEAPRTFQLRQHLVAYAGARRLQQTLDIPTRQKSSPWEISAYREPSASPLPSKHTPCPTWARIVRSADSRWEGIKLRLRRDSGPPELKLIPGNVQLKST